MSKVMNGYINTKNTNESKKVSKHVSKDTKDKPKHASKHNSKTSRNNSKTSRDNPKNATKHASKYGHKNAPTNIKYKSKTDPKKDATKMHKQIDDDEHDTVDNNEVKFEAKNDIDEATLKILKKKITEWVDYDDKIKDLASKAKQYKDAKKKQEEFVINMIMKLEMIEDSVFDVHDKKNNIVRGRVYPYKSVTKEALSNEIIKNALMEVVHNEKQVDLLIKKIDNKRPIKERYYLKRTTGNKIDK